MHDLREQPRSVDLKRLAEMTAEQRRATAEKANKIFEKDAQLQQAALVLREARRLYTLGRSALSRRMDELGHSSAQDYEAVIVEAMNKASMHEFTRDEVADAMQRVVLPFVAFELAAQRSREEAVAEQAAQAEEQKRRANRVPVGLSMAHAAPFGDRGSTVLFVGPRNAIKGLFDHVAQFLPTIEAERRVACVRLLDTLKEHTVVSRFEKEVLDIGVNRWGGQAPNIKEFTRFMSGWMRQTYKSRVDLLIIDDLAELAKALIDGYPRERMAAAALKVVNRWAAENGAAVLAGLPAVEDVPQTHDEATAMGWKELYEHSRVILLRRDEYSFHGRPPGTPERMLVFSSDPSIYQESTDDSVPNCCGVCDQTSAGLREPAAADEAGREAGEAQPGA